MATTKKAPKSTTSRAKKAPSVAQKTKVTRTKAPAAAKRAPAKAKTNPAFFTFRATNETLYWIILGVAVIALASWVMVLTVRIQNLYDQMQIDNATNMVMPQPKADQKK